MKRNALNLITLMVIVLLAGCSLIAPAKSSPTSTFPPPLTTEPALPTFTTIPATATLAPTPSPTPYQPFEALTLVSYLNLRSGPGFLVDSLGMYDEGIKVSVLGHAPGASWLYVRTPDEKQGWMKLELLNLQGHSMYDTPEVIPDGFVVVKGHLYMPNGNPVSHVTMSLKPVEEENDPREDAATTDTLGRFYFFLPPGTRGNWILSAGGYGCESSAVDSSCSLLGTFPIQQTLTITEDDPDIWYNQQMLP